MSNLKNMTGTELLLSFDNGQGKTFELPNTTRIETTSEGQLVYRYGHYSANVSQGWVEAQAVLMLNKDLKTKADNVISETLALFEAGFLGANHKTAVEKSPADKPVAKVKTAITGHYLTSDEMLDNYFKLVEFEQVKAVFELLSSLNDKKTKEELLKVISACKHLLVTSEQLQAVQVLQDKERGLILGKNALETLGCSDIQYVSDTRLSALCNYRNYDDVLAQIKDLLVYDPTADTSRGGSVTIFFDVIEG